MRFLINCIPILLFTSLFITTVTIPEVFADADTKLLLRFDGVGNNVIDSSDSNHQIIINGDTTQVSTPDNQVIPDSNVGSFDGSGDNLEIGDSPDFDWSGDFTIEAWIKPQNDTALLLNHGDEANGVLFGFDGAISPSWIYFIAYDNGPVIALQGISSGIVIPATEWHHVAVTRSGSTIRYFVDGLIKASGTLSGNMPDPTDSIFIGSQQNDTRFYDGQIEELRFSTVDRYPEEFSGNLPTAPHSLTPVDTETPVVAAPGDIIIEAEDAITTVNLENNPGQIPAVATATDNITDPVIPFPDKVLLNGSITSIVPNTTNNTVDLPVGIYTIVWRAEDGIGNADERNQIVEVRDTTEPSITLNWVSKEKRLQF